MDDVAFDALSRRASLMTLGAAGLAALGHPVTAGAKKAKQECKNQEGRLMNTRAFDALTRHAADAVSRRAALVTLGGAALAAAVASPGVSAAKKRVGKTCKKKEKKRCNNDAAACRTTLVLGCVGDDECIALLTPCCDTCSANGFFACFLEAALGM
jgi:hypothetical protein